MRYDDRGWLRVGFAMRAGLLQRAVWAESGVCQRVLREWSELYDKSSIGNMFVRGEFVGGFFDGVLRCFFHKLRSLFGAAIIYW